MKKVTVTGKSVDEAVKLGLSQLGAAENQVKVTVLEQPSKGLFGLIGSKLAKVELELIEDAKPAAAAPTSVAETVAHPVEPVTAAAEKLAEQGKGYEHAERFLMEVFAAMNLQVQLEKKQTDEGLLFNFVGSELGILIGRRGQTLDSLQYLVNIVANRHQDDHLRIVLDAENFRERRKKTLEDLAHRLAGRVLKTRKEVVLEPMSPQERKVIHANLQNHPKVKTYSKGEEPNRRVVITLK